MNKVLARAGLGSRRAVESLIEQGRVEVGGTVVRDLSVKVDPAKTIVRVDGQRVRHEPFVYIAVHKPKGYLSTNADPAGRPRVVDLLPDLPHRVFPIGRLDEESFGLILLTNDGELANRLAHPRYGVEKVYRALVAGKPEPHVVDKLMQGVWLAEGKARAKHARILPNRNLRAEATIIQLTLAEGKNREVRRMLAKLGHKVMSLTRIAVGPIQLKGLSAGQWRYLEPEEIAKLRRVASGQSESAPPRTRPAAPRKPERRPSIEPKPARSGFGHLIGSETQAGEGQGNRARRPQATHKAGQARRATQRETTRVDRRSSDSDQEMLVPPIGGNRTQSTQQLSAEPRQQQSKSHTSSGPQNKQRLGGRSEARSEQFRSSGYASQRRPMPKRRPKPLPKSRRQRPSGKD